MKIYSNPDRPNEHSGTSGDDHRARQQRSSRSDRESPARVPDVRGSDPRFRSTRASSGARGQRPDFEGAIDAMQRWALELEEVEVKTPARPSCLVKKNLMVFESPGDSPYAVALFRVKGLAENPLSPSASDRVTSLSGQVLTGLCKESASYLHLMLGDGFNVEFYVGVKTHASTQDQAVERARKAGESLETCLVAVYPDIRLERLEGEDQYLALMNRIASMKASVSLVGNPSPPYASDSERSNADRLLEALGGANYGYCVEAVPIGDEAVVNEFENMARCIAQTHDHVKWTTSGSKTSTTQESHEQIDRFAQQYELLLEIGIEKLDLGLREGMWQANVALLGADRGQVDRAGALLRSVYAGANSRPEPVKLVRHKNGAACIASLSSFHSLKSTSPKGVSTGLSQGSLWTALPSSEAGLLVELPHKEAPGFRISHSRQFALDLDRREARTVEVGTILSRMGPTGGAFGIDLDDMTRHALLVGVTGSGKTNTCMYLLEQIWRKYGIPFLVIEPAKAQYRDLLTSRCFKDLQVFAPGHKNIAPFRMNPFEFPRGINPQAHITNLYTVFNAAFILYAPMPYVLERALFEVYEDRGWDLALGAHVDAESEAADAPWLAFPTLTDLYYKIEEVVDRLGYESRIQMDVTAGLQARVDSLRVGNKGQTFDCHRSVPFSALLQRPTIMELSHIGSDEEKAFLIGLLLMRLYESRELEGDSLHLKHVTLVEEAHRLLTKTSTDSTAAEVANMKGKSVETFCNILAEIRSYGEGLLIAEQIPTKLAPDVIKNTNLKVMHRLVAIDDRELMGGAMNVMPHQTMAVTSLRRGEAVVFAEGLENPMLVKVPQYKISRQASDSDIHRTTQLFDRQYPEVQRQFPGCSMCTSICRFGAMAKRICDDGQVRVNLWQYMVSCLHSPGAPLKGWERLAKHVLSSKPAKTVKPPGHDDLVCCVCQIAAERCFLELQRRGGVSLNDIASLLKSSAKMFRSVASKSEESVICVSQFRAKLGRLLKSEDGPFPICEVCSNRCFFATIGHYLAAQPNLRRGLSEAFKKKDRMKVVRTYCRGLARRALYTDHPKTVDGLALCFYIHAAEAVGAKSTIERVKLVFGQS